MMTDPKCLYCGETMMDDWYTWHCPICHSSSPVVIYEEKCQTMTEEEKKAYAREVALKPALSKWIGVEDRLPEEIGQVCIAYMPHYHEYIIAEYAGCGEWTDKADLCNVTRLVTHWMPLPEPPKEEC